ncbi:hypothetical protein [Streptomyces misionensis]|uniref:hypothetical protein n=1 Tax=Streptomyces misionensis TaxID=67331 RepID=UPI0033A4EAEB
MFDTITVTADEQRQIFDRLAPHLPACLQKVEPSPYGGLRFEFAEFTGREEEPVKPGSYYQDPRLTYVHESEDASEHRIRWAAQLILGDLYDRARAQWKMAAYVADLREVVRDAPERWEAYEREAAALEAAYAYLRTAPAAQEWPAALSRLVDAQDRTLAAAIAFDDRARDIAAVHYQHLYADLSPDQALEKAGYPGAKSWHVGDGFGGYFRDSLQEKVADLIRQQESHLSKVGRLIGA